MSTCHNVRNQLLVGAGILGGCSLSQIRSGITDKKRTRVVTGVATLCLSAVSAVYALTSLSYVPGFGDVVLDLGASNFASLYLRFAARRNPEQLWAAWVCEIVSAARLLSTAQQTIFGT
jgi:hypothetical protein